MNSGLSSVLAASGKKHGIIDNRIPCLVVFPVLLLMLFAACQGPVDNTSSTVEYGKLTIKYPPKYPPQRAAEFDAADYNVAVYSGDVSIPSLDAWETLAALPLAVGRGTVSRTSPSVTLHAADAGGADSGELFKRSGSFTVVLYTTVPAALLKTTGVSFNFGCAEIGWDALALSANRLGGDSVETLTNVADVKNYLNLSPAGEETDPVQLKVQVQLTEENWLAILEAVSSARKFVNLDLFACTPSSSASGGGLRSDGTFDPMDRYQGLGKDRIVSLVLPGAASAIAGGSVTSPSFRYFSKLSSVQAQNVSSIGSYAFAYLESLRTVVIPNAETIDEGAFRGSVALKEVSFPKVTKVCPLAFASCAALDSVNLPAAITIGDNAFAVCTGLTDSGLFLPNVDVIGPSAFSGCTGLISLSFPRVTAIEDGAFSGCTGLSSVSIPIVAAIGSGAFDECPVTKITIGAEVSAIGSTGLDENFAAEYTRLNQAKGLYTQDAADPTKWTTSDFYLVDFVVFDGEAVPDSVPALAPVAEEAGSLLKEPEPMTMTGYDFMGWYKDSAHSELWNFETDTVTGDITLYAKWDIWKRDVTFMSDGVEFASQTVDYGQFASAPSSGPEKPGHTFGAWFLGGTPETTAYDFGTPVTEDITLNANWTINQYTVTFMADGTDAEVPSRTVDYDQHISAPNPAPGKTGHTFAGWYKDPDCTETERWDFETDKVTADITLYAKLTPIKYTVTFMADGTDAEVPSQTVEFEQRASEPDPAPTKDGYTFGGWYLDNEFRSLYDFNIPVQANITLYAKWMGTQEGKYTVTLEVNGGASMSPFEVEPGAKIDEDTITPSREGHTFAGWYKDPDCTEFWGFETDTVMGPITLYASWTINRYTVTFMNDEAVFMSPTVEYGQPVPEPSVPPQEGYTFVGWYKDSECTVLWDFGTDTVMGNIAIYAKWVEVTPPPAGE